MKKNLLLVFIVFVALASCKKNDPAPPELTAITLSKDTLAMNVGDAKTINFTLTPSTYDKSVLVWRSSDTTILSVNKSGVITAKKEGQVIVSVRNQSTTVTTFCLVSVLPELKAIALSKDTLKMNAGDVKSVNFTLTPSNYDKTALVWHSSDTTILSVNNSGVMTAKKEGQVIVSVRNQGATITAFCLVSVAPKIDNLTIGLIDYYPFNNSGLDKSGNSNDGTLYNISSVPDRFGKINAAYHFDGSTSYISVPDKPALRLNNTDFTLNAWVKLESYNPTYLSSIMSKRFSGVNNGWVWGINGPFNTPNGATYYGPGGGNADAIGNTVLTVGQWYMVTCIYSLANSQLSIYVNGILDHTVNGILTANASTTAILYIGKDTGSGANDYFFHGTLDEIRIYNRAINANELQKLYTATE